MATKLPKWVCVLDLETQKSDFKSPEKCELAFVGTKIYMLEGKQYEPQRFRHYLQEEMKELEVFLREFDGVVIGHNILGFDYRVLRPNLSLEGIIEKTVDTLAFLYFVNEEKLRGLSLQGLSKANFGKSKTIEGKEVSRLWRQGKHQEVIAYNENDCSLTMDLWWHLVKKRSVKVEYDYGSNSDSYMLRFSKESVPRLMGLASEFTFSTWEQKINTDGFVLIPQRQSQRRHFSSDKWEDEEEYGGEDELEQEVIYYWFFCAKCRKTYLFQAQIVRGFSDYEQVKCPQCEEPFGEIRADLGYSLIGAVEGKIGNGMSQGDVPMVFREMIIKHIHDTQREWSRYGGFWGNLVPFSETKTLCKICGHELGTHEREVFDNPIDGSEICAECLTAGRWLLLLK